MLIENYHKFPRSLFMTHIVVVVRMGRTPFVLSAYGVEKQVKP